MLNDTLRLERTRRLEDNSRVVYETPINQVIIQVRTRERE